MKKIISILFMMLIFVSMLGCEKRNGTVSSDVGINKQQALSSRSVSGEAVKTSGSVSGEAVKIPYLNDEYLCDDTKPGYKIIDETIDEKGKNYDIHIHYPKFLGKSTDGVNRCIMEAVYKNTNWLSQMNEQKDGKNKNMRSISLEYTVKKSTERFVSVRFDGLNNMEGTAHPLNVAFCINYDIRKNKKLPLSEVITDSHELYEEMPIHIEKYANTVPAEDGYVNGLKHEWEKIDRDSMIENDLFYVEGGTLFWGIRFNFGSFGVDYIPIN